MNLYELTNDFSRIADRLEDMEAEQGPLNGTLEDVLYRELGLLEVDGNQVCAHLLQWVRNLEANIEARQTEIARLKAKNDSDNHKICALRAYVLRWLQASNQHSLKTPLGTMSRRKGSVKTFIDLEEVKNWPAAVYDEAVEKDVIREKVEVMVSNLKKVFPDNYRTLPGVKEEQSEESLQIR